MLQARSNEGLMILLSALTRKEIENARRHQHFFCPICKEPVIIKAGTKIVPHFAHRSKTICPASGGEGPYHEKGKLILYQWLKSQYPEVMLEPYLTDINQIPDIYLILKGRKIAIEFQCAKIDIQSIQLRNQGYKKKGIIPIWILGANQFRRLGKHHLQVNSFVQQFIHQFSTDYPRTLYYFCPDTLQTATFHHIYFTRNNVAFGTLTFQKIFQTTFHNLFSVQRFPSTTIYDLWKKEKKKFRLTRRPHWSRRERHWHQWLYLKRTSIEHLPSIVYLPISTQYLMNIPLWEWQSRLTIDFLQPIVNGERFSIKTCEHRLRPYLNSPFDFPLIQSQQNPIEEYIHLLEQLKIIKRISSHEYIKTKAIHFHTHIDHALSEDMSLLNKLSGELNLNKKQA